MHCVYDHKHIFFGIKFLQKHYLFSKIHIWYIRMYIIIRIGSRFLRICHQKKPLFVATQLEADRDTHRSLWTSMYARVMDAVICGGRPRAERTGSCTDRQRGGYKPERGLWRSFVHNKQKTMVTHNVASTRGCVS